MSDSESVVVMLSGVDIGDLGDVTVQLFRTVEGAEREFLRWWNHGVDEKFTAFQDAADDFTDGGGDVQILVVPLYKSDEA